MPSRDPRGGNRVGVSRHGPAFCGSRFCRRQNDDAGRFRRSHRVAGGIFWPAVPQICGRVWESCYLGGWVWLMFRIKDSKNFFFFDQEGRARVFAGVDRARRKVLSKSGAIVRQIARRSIRKARRKRLSELDHPTLINYRIRQKEAVREGRPAPALPVSHSLPGEPPRSIAGHLRNFLFFAFDPQSKTVLVGPARLSGQGQGIAPNVLEYGGTSNGSIIKPRPFMRPAERKARDKYMKLWKDSIK